MQLLAFLSYVLLLTSRVMLSSERGAETFKARKDAVEVKTPQKKKVKVCRVPLLSPTVHESHISFILYGAYTLFRHFILRLQVNIIYR